MDKKLLGMSYGENIGKEHCNLTMVYWRVFAKDDGRVWERKENFFTITRYTFFKKIFLKKRQNIDE